MVADNAAQQAVVGGGNPVVAVEGYGGEGSLTVRSILSLSW